MATQPSKSPLTATHKRRAFAFGWVTLTQPPRDAATDRQELDLRVLGLLIVEQDPPALAVGTEVLHG